MAGESLPARFSLRGQLWFRGIGKCFETATSHMQTVGGNSTKTLKQFKTENMEQQEILDQTNEGAKSKKRPTVITVICVIGFIGAAFTIPMIFSDITGQVGSWYPPYLGLSVVIGFICMIGLWQMKKWAAYTYTGFVALNQIVLLTMGVWNIMALIIPGIVIGIALAHVSKMD